MRGPSGLRGHLRSELRESRPARHDRRVESRPGDGVYPTLGFVSHVHTDLISAARQAGADDVLARSAFAGNLADILLSTGTASPDHNRRHHCRGTPHRGPRVAHASSPVGMAITLERHGRPLKLETLQPTFSYKIRGAWNTVFRLADGGNKRPRW